MQVLPIQQTASSSSSMMPYMAKQTTSNTMMSSGSYCRKKLDFDSMTENSKPSKKQSKNLLDMKEGKSSKGGNMPKCVSNSKRNARERKRVRTINDFFSQLQKYLPCPSVIGKASPNGTAKSSGTATPNSSTMPGGIKKLSKVETLKAAIDYIEFLLKYAPPDVVAMIEKSTKQQHVAQLSTKSMSQSSLLSSPTTKSPAHQLNATSTTSFNTQYDESNIKSASVTPARSMTTGNGTGYEASSMNNNFTYSSSPKETYTSVNMTSPSAIYPSNAPAYTTPTILNPIDFNIATYSGSTSSTQFNSPASSSSGSGSSSTTSSSSSSSSASTSPSSSTCSSYYSYYNNNTNPTGNYNGYEFLHKPEDNHSTAQASYFAQPDMTLNNYSEHHHQVFHHPNSYTQTHMTSPYVKSEYFDANGHLTNAPIMEYH